MTTPALFSICPLPGCPNLTADPREPCGTCLEAFGPLLRRGTRQVSAEEFAADLARGDAEVAAAYAMQRDLARWSA